MERNCTTRCVWIYYTSSVQYIRHDDKSNETRLLTRDTQTRLAYCESRDSTRNVENTIVVKRTARRSFKVMIHNKHSLRASIKRQKDERYALPCARLVLLLGVLYAVSGTRDLRLSEGQLGLSSSRTSRFLLCVLELSLTLALTLLVLICRRDNGRCEGSGLCVDGLGGAEVRMNEGLGGRYTL